MFLKYISHVHSSGSDVEGNESIVTENESDSCYIRGVVGFILLLLLLLLLFNIIIITIIVLTRSVSSHSNTQIILYSNPIEYTCFPISSEVSVHNCFAKVVAERVYVKSLIGVPCHLAGT